MAEIQHQGIMAMVKIDGGKVKQLREQKSLTQLYVATAVQVTTDTISRWENKRYPTIKKENALRLAEALEVELEDILETHEEDVTTSSTGPEPSTPSGKSSYVYKRLPLFLLAGAILLTIVTAALMIFVQTTRIELSAVRNLPRQCIAGQPFPVSIEITTTATSAIAVILKEHIPAGIEILKTEPHVPDPGIKNSLIKWLHKTDGHMLFTYIAVLQPAQGDLHSFSGSVAASDIADSPVTISGNATITRGNHHWADSDGDNVISDKEILTVYDQYGDLERLGIDVDLIEEIWLGSGYRWDPSSQNYEILP